MPNAKTGQFQALGQINELLVSSTVKMEFRNIVKQAINLLDPKEIEFKESLLNSSKTKDYYKLLIHFEDSRSLVEPIGRFFESVNDKPSQFECELALQENKIVIHLAEGN